MTGGMESHTRCDHAVQANESRQHWWLMGRKAARTQQQATGGRNRLTWQLAICLRQFVVHLDHMHSRFCHADPSWMTMCGPGCKSHYALCMGLAHEVPNLTPMQLAAWLSGIGCDTDG